MTTLNGTLTSCGPGNDFSLHFTCSGPSCSALTGFPKTTCVGDATNSSLTCSNGVTCLGHTNYTANFNLSQTADLVTQSHHILLADFCEEIDATSDGTTGGVDASMISTGHCGTSVNGTLPSGNSTAPSGNSTVPSGSVISSSPATGSTTPASSLLSSTLGDTSTTPVSVTSSTTLSSTSSFSPISCSDSTASPTATYRHSVAAESRTHKSYDTYSTGTPHDGKPTTPVTSSHLFWSHGASHTSHRHWDEQEAGYDHFHDSKPQVDHPEKPHHWTTPHRESKRAPTTFSSSGHPSGKPSTSGASSLRKGLSWSFFQAAAFIACFLLVIQGSAASFLTDSAIDLSLADSGINVGAPFNTTSVDLYERKLTPGWEKFASLFSEYLAGKISSPELAENLIAELASAVCDHAAGVVVSKALGVDLVEECIAAIDVAGGATALATLQPEVEFLAVLGSGILCNLLVSEALSGISSLTEEICHQKKPCSDDLLTDVNNCGSCGNKCATGQSCKNGACSSDTCTGQTCSTFGPCGPGGSCVCASTTEGTGFCVDGNTPCDGLATCETSLDCASGEICAVGSCCDANVCVGATICGGSSNATLTTRTNILERRKWENATIAGHGTWIA